MRQDMSILKLLSRLEEMVKHHESREAHHAEREAHHREQRAAHAAELQTARERLAACRAATEAAGELVDRFQIPAAETPVDDLPPGATILVSRLAARVIATKDPAETFNSTSVTREINQRYGKRLRRPAQARTVAAALRRMAADGRILFVEKSRGPLKASYSRKDRKG